MRASLRLLTILLLVVNFFYPISQSAALFFFLTTLVLFGIPHGAVDHLISVPVLNGKSVMLFIAKYLLIMGLVIVSWIIAPLFTFLLFILLSGYHFGQSQLFYVQSSEGKLLRGVLYLSWGVFILNLLFIFNYEQVYGIINSLFNFQAFNYSDLKAWTYNFAILSGAVFAFLFIILLFEKAVPARYLIKELLDLGILVLVFRFTPLLFAFAVYFGLWHSLSAMSSERKFIEKKSNDRRGLLSFVKQVLPLSIASFLGLAILLVFANIFSNHISPLMVFVVAISCVTFPHAVSMENMYRRLPKLSRKEKAI